MLFLSDAKSPVPPPRKNKDGAPAEPAKPETLYEKLPGSLKAELLVKQTEEDQENTKKNQELVRSMSPAELGNINSLSEFPLPSFGGGKKEGTKKAKYEKEKKKS